MKKLTAQDISTHLRWDGEKILELMLECLTEANYHSLRREIEKIPEAKELIEDLKARNA
jgi:hypothetical protein